MGLDARDPEFWISVAEHPEVAPHVLFGHSGLMVGDVVQHERVLPFRSEHGGYLFVMLDGLGRIYELHSLFTPEAWGTRETLRTAKRAFTSVFEKAALIVTYEVLGNCRSRPPRTFGFASAGAFVETPELGGLMCRTWFLTSEAWKASVVGRRQCH